MNLKIKVYLNLETGKLFVKVKYLNLKFNLGFYFILKQGFYSEKKKQLIHLKFRKLEFYYSFTFIHF